MGKRKSILIASIAAAAMIVAAGCSMEAPVSEATAERVTPVAIEHVTRGDLTIINEIVGTVEPAKQIAVIPEVQGKLQEVRVSKGDIVEAGQVLAVVDDQDLRLALQMEQTNLSISKTQLDAALSRLRQAEDAAKTALREGRDSVQISENLEQARIAAEQARASVRQAELRVQQAQMRVNDAAITAPISGEVVSVPAQAGEFVSMQSPVAVIVSAENPKIRAGITAEQIPLFEAGSKVEVFVPSLDLTLEGTVDALPRAAEQNGLFSVEVIVPDESRQLKFGMAAILRVAESAVVDALLVSTQAIVERGEEFFVFVVEDDAAVLKPVEVVQMQSDVTAIKGDLNEGDKVVVKGQLTLSDGNKVSLMGEGQ